MLENVSFNSGGRKKIYILTSIIAGEHSQFNSTLNKIFIGLVESITLWVWKYTSHDHQ